ncbi:hypothetical protein TeGR_g2784 [Tetraparma gracilis]|uniref:SAM-dependent MTase TRM10-type domain-containing protein n=1 Tax=Tetraparma gracilis TaxID=2962635 RepID=A0ABQ6MHZ5_9STRA|nr:hypothetical protein TeGR_g2784 [Tetraparma gracilis]
MHIVLDLTYGFPSQARPRKERVNALARQTVNFLQTKAADLTSDPPAARLTVVGRSEADLEPLRSRVSSLLAAESPSLSPPSLLSYSTVPLPSLLPPSSRPVYLSPDAPPLPPAAPPRTVLIGGIIDRQIKPNRSLNHAASHAIPSFCLPLSLSSLAELRDDEPLNVDTVMELLVAWERGGSFVGAVGEAMVRHEGRHPGRPVHKTS